MALLWLGGANAAATAIGSRACSACHAEAGRLWQGSAHARSMQHATPASVLGDFADARFTQGGQSSRFFRRGGGYWVHTDGPDGRPGDFEIRYTIGVEPLQQYLIELPGGRLQALGIAWDSRPRTAGGQRWFALYPEAPAAGESVHWTGRDQNWNFMCATCHTTGLRKNFDLAGNRYRTIWDEIDVGCEACHGPGSRHRAWARGKRRGDSGLISPLTALNTLTWRHGGPEQPIARPQGDRTAAKRAEEACYGCHARRREIRDPVLPGAPFLDNYLPALLDPGLYHADGANDGEVFEYGAFVQSKMHRAGVTCGNCHQHHSTRLKATGNALCGQCHRLEHYDQTQHHHHQQAAASCVDCHMPQKTYMGVDVRHDHGFRIPRPATSAATGSPDACSQCHRKHGSAWADEQLRSWRGPAAASDPPPHVAALKAAQHGSAGAGELAAALAAEGSAIVRATALAALVSPATRDGTAAIARAAGDPEPLVRLGAARALASLATADAINLGGSLLADPLRAVRIEAARSLAGLQQTLLPVTTAARLRAAVGELIEAELAIGERPEAQLNLGRLFARQGEPQRAEQALLTALRLAPDFSPAMLNLAELYRGNGRDGAGEPLLRQAVAVAPGNPEASHALGLLLVRQGRLADALPWLAQAAKRAPGNPRYARVHILALAESGDGEAARAALAAALTRQPGDQALQALRINLERRFGQP